MAIFTHPSVLLTLTLNLARKDLILHKQIIN